MRRAGDTLQRLPESTSRCFGRGAAVRWLLPERRTRRRRPFSAQQRHHRDQTSQQHVHVPRQSRSQTHLSRLQVQADRKRDETGEFDGFNSSVTTVIRLRDSTRYDSRTQSSAVADPVEEDAFPFSFPSPSLLPFIPHQPINQS